MNRLRCLVLVLAVFTTQCTPRVSSSDPFAGGSGSSRPRVQTYRIQFDVACDGCRITYSVGAEGGSASTEGSWNRRVRITPLAPVAVRLGASLNEDGSTIYGLRIQVNGETVAETGCMGCDRTSGRMGRGVGSMSIEAIVPPRSRP